MDDPSQKDADASRARSIINHLNNSHQESLSYYLRHYTKVSSRDASNAQACDITYTTISIQSHDGIIHEIPINPPMTSWADARERTVAMDREAKEGLGISDVVITEYQRPRRPVHVLLWCAMIYYWGSYTAGRLGLIVPGTLLYNLLMKGFPGGAPGYIWLQDTIALPVFAIHLAEALWMGSKLQKNGVKRWSGLWWRWFLSAFLEGYGAHQRFNSLVARQLREKEKRSH